MALHWYLHVRVMIIMPTKYLLLLNDKKKDDDKDGQELEDLITKIPAQCCTLKCSLNQPLPRQLQRQHAIHVVDDFTTSRTKFCPINSSTVDTSESK